MTTTETTPFAIVKLNERRTFGTQEDLDKLEARMAEIAQEQIKAAQGRWLGRPCEAFADEGLKLPDRTADGVKRGVHVELATLDHVLKRLIEAVTDGKAGHLSVSFDEGDGYNSVSLLLEGTA
jgi:hypothetical protein